MTTNYSSQLPNRDAAISSSNNMLTDVWYNFMAFMASLKGKDIEAITVGASPYEYEATSMGSLHVAAGNVTSVVLQRGGVSLSCPTAGFVPVAAGDIVTVEYTVAPEMNFIPAPRT